MTTPKKMQFVFGDITLTFTGAAATFIHSLTATAGALTLTGATATFQVSRVLVAAPDLEDRAVVPG